MGYVGEKKDTATFQGTLSFRVEDWMRPAMDQKVRELGIVLDGRTTTGYTELLRTVMEDFLRGGDSKIGNPHSQKLKVAVRLLEEIRELLRQ